jgi:hypothetical protein
VPDRTGGFLFYTARTGILDYRIQDTGTYKSTFSHNLIPNYWVIGVYFDGKTYHDMSEYLVAFDEQQKALRVKVWTDKTEYRPQDKVHVTVEVRDEQGHPVAAKVNLNLVDEPSLCLALSKRIYWLPYMRIIYRAGF